MTDSQPAPKKRVPDAITSELSYSSAIIGTYNLQGRYLEGKILPKLKRVKIKNRIVLTDTETYSNKIDTNNGKNYFRQAGREYYLDHVRCGKVFHPKFVLFLGRERGLALIGSANLTKPGWENNAEMVTTIRFEQGSEEQAGPVFAQLQSFIQGLANENYLPSPQTQKAIDTALEDAPWIDRFNTDRESATPGIKCNVLNNLDQPILPQFISEVNNQKMGDIRKIQVASPYFNDDLRVLRELSTTFSPDKLITILQPELVSGFQPSALDYSDFNNVTTQIRKISFGEEDSISRRLHAKFIRIIGDSGSCILYGSPNATTPGMLKSDSNGNIELAVSRYEQDREYFDYVLNTDIVETSKIEPNDISYDQDYDPSYSSTSEITLLSARVADECLVIEYNTKHPVGEELELRLERVNDDSTKKIRIEPSGPAEIQIDDPSIIAFCTQSTRVSLSAPGKNINSKKRWILFSSLRNAPRVKQLKDIVETDYYSGIVDLMEEANSLNDDAQLIHILENIIDFGGIASEEIDEDEIIDDDDDDENGEGNENDSDDDDDDENGEDDENDSDDDDDEIEFGHTREIRELLFEKFESYHTELDGIIDLPGTDESWKRRTERVLNLYTEGATFILWAATQRRFLNSNKHRVESLQPIRVATEKFAAEKKEGFYIDHIHTLRESAGLEHATKVETELRVLEHVATILYVTDNQLKNNLQMEAELRTYSSYEDAFTEILSELGKTRGGPIPPYDTLKEIIEDHETLDEGIKPEDVRRFCRNRSEP